MQAGVGRCVLTCDWQEGFLGHPKEALKVSPRHALFVQECQSWEVCGHGSWGTSELPPLPYYKFNDPDSFRISQALINFNFLAPSAPPNKQTLLPLPENVTQELQVPQFSSPAPSHHNTFTHSSLEVTG